MKYKVKVFQTWVYQGVIEASSQDEAEDIANEIIPNQGKHRMSLDEEDICVKEVRSK